MNPDDLYLDLLKKSLLGSLRSEQPLLVPARPKDQARRWLIVQVEKRGYRVVRPIHPPEAAWATGLGWDAGMNPPAETMIGRTRLDSLHACLTMVLDERVPGDVIETGVWRGGSSIFMRGVLAVRKETSRQVVVADSFEGLPPPSPSLYPADEGLNLHEEDFLAVSLEQVKANFARYGLLDEQVEFVKGWFSESLPALKGRQWALIRLDGDLYESTIDALNNLYGGLAPGGFAVIDDYGAYEACKAACDDFRTEHGITDPITHIDWAGSFWRKS